MKNTRMVIGSQIERGAKRCDESISGGGFSEFYAEETASPGMRSASGLGQARLPIFKKSESQ